MAPGKPGYVEETFIDFALANEVNSGNGRICVLSHSG